MDESGYEKRLAEEGEVWGRVAAAEAEVIAPDWRFHRTLRHNAIMHTADIDNFLAGIQPGMTALEVGCGSGWLTLAMAQRGADAHGIDISRGAIRIARDYYDSVRDTVSGRASYEVADLNRITLPPQKYDVVVGKGVLHHLSEVGHLLDQIYCALKPGGLLWLADTNGHEALPTVLLASVLTFVLPTEISYRDKLKGLLRFGWRAPERIKASMQAEGLSPFEAAGREHDWLAMIQERFIIERRIDMPAVTGYVTAQLKMPERPARLLLKSLARVDRFLVRRGLLHNTGVVIYARKPGREMTDA